MNALLAWWRRADALCGGARARIVLSAIALILGLALFVPVHRAASRYATLRGEILAAIDGANVQQGDAVAVQLRDAGTVTIRGRDYGGPEIRNLGELLFDAGGRVNAPARIADFMLAAERPRWIPNFLVEQTGSVWSFGLLWIAWLQLIVWTGLALPFAAVLLATALVVAPLLLLEARAAAVAVAGMGLLTFSFVLLVRVALLLLDRRSRAFAVAHTVVKEAVRQKISLVFIVVLLLALPLIPLWIDEAQPLRYQLQTFIARSLALTYAAAACMTLLLACATVAFEIRDRQIWQLMTKPVGRFQYLLGKFVGVGVLNLVLLAICGISIFTFVQYLRTRPAADALDAAAVRDEVLVARSSVRPEFQAIPRAELIERVDAALADDPIMRDEIEKGHKDELEVRRGLAVQIQSDYLRRQRTVEAGQTRTYVFEGLDRARAAGAPLTLRYMFYAGLLDSHSTYPVLFEFPALDLVVFRRFVPVQGHVLAIPAEAIDDQGRVEVVVYNAGWDAERGEYFPGPYAFNFDAKDFELLYKVSEFEWNFVRAMLVLWMKLCFLAALGVCAATILSFPVACIFSFTVFAIGSMAPFIAESLEYWYVESAWRLDQLFVMAIAAASEWTMRSFGAVQPTRMLVEGRLIGAGDVLAVGLNLGLVWCGAVLLLGWLAFSRKELAIYSGHG